MYYANLVSLIHCSWEVDDYDQSKETWMMYLIAYRSHHNMIALYLRSNV